MFQNSGLVLTIFNEGAYLTFKSIIHKAHKFNMFKSKKSYPNSFSLQADFIYMVTVRVHKTFLFFSVQLEIISAHKE